MEPENRSSDEEPPPDALHIPVDGVLDLHTFQPSEAKAVVLEYIEACRENGIRDLRIIHGKGKGILRAQIHALLQRHPAVASIATPDPSGGSWGATIVTLKPPTP